MGIETIVVAVAPIVLYLLKLLTEVKSANVSASEQARLMDVAEMAVQAAQELGRKGGGGTDEEWGGEEKMRFASEIIRKGFPKLDEDAVNSAVHSAVAVLKLAAKGL